MNTTAENPLDLTFDQALARFAEGYLQGGNRAARTRIEYLADLSEAAGFLAELGITRVAAVTTEQLERYLASLDRRGLKGSTRRRKAVSIRVFFRYLAQRHFLPSSPADTLIPPRAEQETPRFLTESEYKRVLAAARHDSRDLAILELFIQTGIRRLELVNLTLSDIQLPEKMPRGDTALGRMHIRSGKGRKERIITLNDPACRALRAYLAVRPDSDDQHLFLSKFKRGLGSWGVEDVVKKHLAAAGVDDASAHALRHTFGTQHVLKGTNLRVIQEALGHDDLRTTSRYVGLVREQMDKQLQENAL